MHPGILSAGIENGGHWPWPWRSFWPFWLRILGNLACPHSNSSQIWVWITKFAPNMHPLILLAGITNGGHWPWPSRSFRPFWLWILWISAYLLGFEPESSNLHQISIVGLSHVVLKMEVIDLDLRGHLAIISTQATALSVALVYWTRPAKGYYTSQT